MTKRRGRPAANSVLAQARKLKPIVSAPDLARLLEVDPRFIYDIVKSSNIESEDTVNGGRTPIPIPIKRAKPPGPLRWFRDDVLRWIEGPAA